MDPQEISKYEYAKLSLKIEKHNEIQSALKEAYELTKSVKEERDKSKNNPKRYQELDNMLKSFVKEYKDLEKSIINAINNDKKITEDEKAKIMFELSDIVSLAEKSGIKESKNFWSKAGDRIKGTDTDKVKAEAIKLSEKKELITKYFKKEKFSETELKKLLTISNEDRKKLGEYKTGNTAGKVASLFGLDSTSADVFLSQEEVIRTNQFQDDIIKRIGLEKGYNGNGDIHAYHLSMGNYITNAPLVESALRTNNVQNLGNKALKNYLGFLESKGELTAENLIKKFEKNKANEILGFVERQKEKDADLKGASFLGKIGSLIEGVKNYFREKILPIFNKIKSSNTIIEFKNNLNSIKNLEGEEKKALLEEFDIEIKNKESALRKLFFEPVKAKLIKNGKSEAEANIEAEKVTNEVLNEIESNISVSNLDKVFNIIGKFNIKYDAKLSQTQTASKAAEVSGAKSEKAALEHKTLAEEAIRNGNPEEARKHEENARTSMTRASEAKTVGKIIAQITEQEAIDIGTGKLEYKKHLEKILSENENLKTEIENLEKEKKEIQIIKNGFNNIEDNSSNTKIETNSYSYNTNSGSLEINLPNGTHNISLSVEEKNIVKSSPEALKNIIDFYKTLNELGLSDLWEYRKYIFTAIGNKKGIGFNIGSNYFEENNVKIFLNSILSSIGEEKIDSTKSMAEFKNIFSQKNNRQIISNGYSDNAIKKGSSKITETFLQKYVLGKPYFDIDGFTKNI
ncbi:MAG: hypothetical protein PHI37_01265 [Candidatus Gracilibacteria bacterium]|nr:hypothetical protein [Candidatus Gracilibacteria bacterium]